MSNNDYWYLTMVAGARSGTNFEIEPQSRVLIGRGLDCDIVLADPLCSRIHAELFHEAESWKIRDAESRNGTYVNGEAVESVALEPGFHIRLGSTEFTLQHSADPPTLATGRDTRLTESIVQDALLESSDSGNIAISSLRNSNHAQDLEQIYRLSVALLGCDDPGEVIDKTLGLLHDRTEAAVVGFLWVSDEGALKPKSVLPRDAAESISLSESLTKVVLKQKRAIWVANHSSVGSSESLRHYADALCVPLVHAGHILGAIHLYLRHGNFRQVDFDFAISVAQVLSVALARTRRQASLAAEHERLVRSSASSDELLGKSPAMVKLKDKIMRIAQATGCVLVRGESGCGKELVARALHQQSNRRDRPLLSVNCAAIPDSLIESHLFGHIQGAFTGATHQQPGWFQQADTGTLFLDEVGELPLEGQAKLLRILEGHPFLPVGGSTEISVDVRIIAATNRDLRDFVRDKRFREDLYYRLTVFELLVPPLRNRGDDLSLLIDHFVEQFKQKHGRPKLKFSDQALKTLQHYSWPGNVRQLRNAIDSAVVMATGDTIQSEDLGLHDAGIDHLETLKITDWERKLIRRALEQTGGNVPEAAKLLGIGRATLYRKIDEYGLKK